MPITASMLYDLVSCPQRVALDAFADSAARDEINSFVRLLWERGALFERETIDKLELPFLDLSHYEAEERERLTLDAMQRGDPRAARWNQGVDGSIAAQSKFGALPDTVVASKDWFR
jgi:hypothetical protein